MLLQTEQELLQYTVTKSLLIINISRIEEHIGWVGFFFGLTKFVEQLSKNFFYLTVRHSESKR